jgi:O-antigen/teichoic acid export membrane protein
MLPSQWMGVVLLALGLMVVALGFFENRRGRGPAAMLNGASLAALAMTVSIGNAAPPLRLACLVAGTVFTAAGLAVTVRRRRRARP